MAAPKRDNHLAAKVLVEAHLTSDAQACAKFNIARRTLQNYRQQLETDAELAHLFHHYAQAMLERSWSVELDETLRLTLTKLREQVDKLEEENPARTVTLLLDVFKTLGEVAIAKEMFSHERNDRAATEAQAPGAEAKASFRNVN